jgi:DUF1365 family protein
MPVRYRGGVDPRGGLVTAALYPCEITHVRARPVRRAFRYRSYLWLVDLDDLPRVPLALRPFAGFRSRDHPGDPASSIRANVDAYLARQGISLPGGRVLMLGHAAVLGYVFNPLTLRLSVTLHTGGRALLAASVTGKRRTYTPRRLLGCALHHPWVTAQVTALIHWQGIRIAARRLPIIPRPARHAQEGAR